jgi:hypothetical protein
LQQNRWRCTAVTFAIFNMICRLIAWRAERGVRPLTPTKAQTSFQTVLMTCGDRHPDPAACWKMADVEPVLGNTPHPGVQSLRMYETA